MATNRTSNSQSMTNTLNAGNSASTTPPAVTNPTSAVSTSASAYNLTPGNKSTLITQIKELNPKLTDAYLNSLGDDRLIDIYEGLADRETNYSERNRDRQDTMKDFSQQLSALTGSKQRQAEQAGRIAQAAQRTQGLASMMQNF